MNLKKFENIYLVLIDFGASYMALFLFYMLKFKTGVIDNPIPLYLSDVQIPIALVSFAWVLFFWFSGLYGLRSPHSRFDETISVFKTVSIGCIIIFILTIQFINILSPARFMVITYWIDMFIVVGSARILYRTLRRRRLLKGKGLLPSILVGWNDRSKALHSRIKSFPGLGYEIVGYISTRKEDVGKSSEGVEVMGSLPDLPEIIKEKRVKEVILALSSNDHERLIDVINYVNGEAVGIKISPDMYDIISGQARTNQIYGLPLIDILPELMPAWERSVKRLTDLFVSVFVLTVLSPLWLIIGTIIKFDSKGNFLYRQERVGKDGKTFTIYKFRSMRMGAESDTGPVWASEDDPRITKVGNFLRICRLDEIPQFINVLKGDMSLVGPRPERQFFVDQLKKEMPLYTKRLRIRPGITGWAQIKHKYDESLDDVKRKLRYDLFYLENMSLRMDFKILLSTVRVMFGGKGH